MTAVDMIHFKLAHNGETRRFILPYLPYLERGMLDRLHVRVCSIVGVNDVKLMWKTRLPDGDIPLETVGDLTAAIEYTLSMAEPSSIPCVHLEVVGAASAVGNELQTEVKTAADLPECDSDDDDIGPYCTIQASKPVMDSSSERPVPPPRPSKTVNEVSPLLENYGNVSLSEESSDDGQSVHERQSILSCPTTRSRDQLQQRPREIGVRLPSLQRHRSESLQLSPSVDVQSAIGALTEPISLVEENIRLKKDLKKVKKEFEEYRMKTVEMRLTEVERRLKELEKKDEEYEKRDMEMISEIHNIIDGMNERIEALEDRH